MDQLRRALDSRYRTLDTVPARRLATVSAVDAATASLTLTWPDGTTSAGVPYLWSYPPQVNDVVLVDLIAGAPVVLGLTGRPASLLSQSDVATSQTTASGTYTDLATAGPAITVHMAVGQKARVTVSAQMSVSATTGGARISFAVSDAETAAAADSACAIVTSTVAITGERTTVFTAAAAGSHIFTCKYRTGSGVTGTFFDRRITVEVR